jgi:hypothetical protein
MIHFIFGYAAGFFTIPAIILLLVFKTEKGKKAINLLKPTVKIAIRNMQMDKQQKSDMKMNKQHSVRHLK